MKTMIVLFLTFISLASFASPTVCRNYGGTGETLRTNTPKYSYIDLCRFGTSGIEALTLDTYVKHQSGAYVVQKYIANRVYWPKDCVASGGWIITALDSKDDKIKLCEFQDGSMMEARTFGLGIDAPENMRMNQVLGID